MKETTITMGDLFTEIQWNHILKVCRDNKYDQDKVTIELKPYLTGLREQLEAKGLLPEYAAYAIPYYICTHHETPGKVGKYERS